MLETASNTQLAATPRVGVEVDLDAPPPLPDDHEPMSHVVRQADLADALVSGGTVVALCGHRFSPKLINPDLEPCQTCLRIAASGAYT
jgi:hypothetical protein